LPGGTIVKSTNVFVYLRKSSMTPPHGKNFYRLVGLLQDLIQHLMLVFTITGTVMGRRKLCQIW